MHLLSLFATSTGVTGLPNIPAFVGIYLTFRIFSDFDLTVEGSLVTGAAVTAILVIHGWPWPLAMGVAVVAGGLAGLVTTVLHVVLRIPVLLSGLVMSLALYSINLEIMTQPTVAVTTQSTLFSTVAHFSGERADWVTIGICGGVVVVVLFLLAVFLRTEIGLAMRAAGANSLMARSYGVNNYLMLGIALVLGNALTELSGSLLAQSEGFADVNMGLSVLIAGIGAILLGELILRPTTSQVARIMFTVSIGTLLYQFIQVVSLQIGISPNNLELVTALTLIFAIGARMSLSRTWQTIKSHSTDDLSLEASDRVVRK